MKNETWNNLDNIFWTRIHNLKYIHISLLLNKSLLINLCCPFTSLCCHFLDLVLQFRWFWMQKGEFLVKFLSLEMAYIWWNSLEKGICGNVCILLEIFFLSSTELMNLIFKKKQKYHGSQFENNYFQELRRTCIKQKQSTVKSC